MSAVDLNNLSINDLKKLVKKELNENKKLKEDKNTYRSLSKVAKVN